MILKEVHRCISKPVRLTPWQVAAFAGEALLQRLAASYGLFLILPRAFGLMSTTALVQVSFGEFGLSPGSLLANLRLSLGTGEVWRCSRNDQFVTAT